MEGIIIVVSIILVLVLFVELRGYRDFINAAESLTELTTVFQSSFVNISTTANKVAEDQLNIRQGLSIIEQEMDVIRTVLEIHSESLNITKLDKIFKQIDELKNS